MGLDKHLLILCIAFPSKVQTLKPYFVLYQFPFFFCILLTSFFLFEVPKVEETHLRKLKFDDRIYGTCGTTLKEDEQIMNKKVYTKMYINCYYFIIMSIEIKNCLLTLRKRKSVMSVGRKMK